MNTVNRLTSIRLLSGWGLVASAAVTAGAAEESDLRFVPPAEVRPSPRVIEASRGSADAPSVVVLSDNGAQWTAKERPVIYWYISRPTDRPVVVALNDPAKKRTLVRIEVKPPIRLGIQKVDFAEARQLDGGPVKLEPGVVYEVAVRLLLDKVGGAGHPLSRVGIQRLAPDRIPPRLNQVQDPLGRARLCARNGLWFDYLDELNAALAKDPSNQSLLDAHAQALAERGFTFETDGRVNVRDDAKPAETRTPPRRP